MPAPPGLFPCETASEGASPSKNAKKKRITRETMERKQNEPWRVLQGLLVRWCRDAGDAERSRGRGGDGGMDPSAPHGRRELPPCDASPFITCRSLWVTCGSISVTCRSLSATWDPPNPPPLFVGVPAPCCHAVARQRAGLANPSRRRRGEF